MKNKKCGRASEKRCSAACLFSVIVGPTNRGKSLQTGNDHIVVPAGAVDNEQIIALIPSCHNAHMGVLRVENQITGKCVRPCDGSAVAVLHHSTTAVTEDIGSAACVVEHPIRK